ncbi:MAG: ATP-binding protein [Proteobacteria bacterium]|nr:ATP-binding protein [Pseudomonadota bacterium]
MKSDIIQALKDWNPWLDGGDFPQELLGFPRSYDLKKYLDIPEIKILEGGRRVGKSTLIYQVIKIILAKSKNVLYINFDDEILSQYSLKSIIDKYNEHAEVDYLFVDEVQRCSDWVPFIRKAYDQKQFKQIWLTGSNSALISEEYATLLTGRKISIHIHPLSFKEYLHFQGVSSLTLPLSTKSEISVKRHFKEYLHLGSFPAIALRSTLQRELLISYFEDFIYKDIVARYEVKPTKLKDLAIYLATNSGKQISYRKVSAALGLHPETVNDYIGYFKEIFMFDECYKFDFSLKSQLSYDKKIYSLDTGMSSAVSFKFSEDHGRQLENLVFNTLQRNHKEIYFHKKQKECDFLVKDNLDITQAIQVSVSLSDPDTKQREINGLCEAMQSYGLEKGLILTLDEEGSEEVVIQDRPCVIEILPVWKWLLSLL